MHVQSMQRATWASPPLFHQWQLPIVLFLLCGQLLGRPVAQSVDIEVYMQIRGTGLIRFGTRICEEDFRVTRWFCGVRTESQTAELERLFDQFIGKCGSILVQMNVSNMYHFLSLFIDCLHLFS